MESNQSNRSENLEKWLIERYNNFEPLNNYYKSNNSELQTTGGFPNDELRLLFWEEVELSEIEYQALDDLDVFHCDLMLISILRTHPKQHESWQRTIKRENEEKRIWNEKLPIVKANLLRQLNELEKGRGGGEWERLEQLGAVIGREAYECIESSIVDRLVENPELDPSSERDFQLARYLWID